jgi:hypothetical protein
MIPPFHRSRLFWLGLPGLVFLLWAWLGSPLNLRVRISIGDYILRVGGEDRALKVDWEVYGSGHLAAPGLRFYKGGMYAGDIDTEGQRFFPKALRYDVRKYHYHLGVRSIPEVKLAYWFLLLFYMMIWLLVLTVWQRRKFRLLKLHAASSRDHEPGSINAPDQG